MNYIFATLIGLVMGFLIPKIFKKIKLGLFASLAIGAGSALAGFHVIHLPKFFPRGIAGVILASLVGVFCAFVNVKPYFKPKLPALTLIVRVFLGLFMLASGIMMWMVNPQPGEHLPGLSAGRLANWLQAVIDTGYLWQFIFGFKIVNGILLLIPRTCTVGILGAVPYYGNILAYTLALANLWLFLSVPAFLATAFLVFAHWDQYKQIVIRANIPQR